MVENIIDSGLKFRADTLTVQRLMHRRKLPMTLTKAKIINDVHEKIGYPKKEAGQVVETLLEIMKSSLEDGEDILISGFGKFCVKDKNERKGRNPATGDSMMLDKRRVITFRCSATLRNKINHK